MKVAETLGIGSGGFCLAKDRVGRLLKKEIRRMETKVF